MRHQLNLDLEARDTVVGLRRVTLCERFARLNLGEPKELNLVVPAAASARSPLPRTAMTTTSSHWLALSVSPDPVVMQCKRRRSEPLHPGVVSGRRGELGNAKKVRDGERPGGNYASSEAYFYGLGTASGDFPTCKREAHK
ncbi:MAG: hypothetical protein E6375_04270 [Dermabacter sp.]|nr:hypothetical protein [Dermabacter sp.]